MCLCNMACHYNTVMSFSLSPQSDSGGDAAAALAAAMAGGLAGSAGAKPGGNGPLGGAPGGGGLMEEMSALLARR